MVNLIFIGPPSSGKATQMTRLVERCRIVPIDYGALVRDALLAETPLGRDTRHAVESGNLVPDNVLIGLVEERLTASSGSQGYVLIGIPKTVKQAEVLQHTLSRIARPVDMAVFFDLDLEIMISRLSQRNPAPIADQMTNLKIGYEHFMSASGKLSSFYSALGRSLRIDANLSSDDVASQIEVGIANKDQPR